MSQYVDDELACCRTHFPDAIMLISDASHMNMIVAMDQAQKIDGINRLACLDEQENKRLPKTRYAEVSTSGELRVVMGTAWDRGRFVRQGADAGVWAESGTEIGNFPRLWPVAAYGWFLLDKEKEDAANGGRRLNTVANAMMWELTGPVDAAVDEGLAAEYGELTEPSKGRAQTRFRGNVVFHAAAQVGLDDEQLGVIEAANQAAVRKLVAKGWLK
ncbi:hypothetical protein ACLQ17_25855 [Streptomyces sp. DT197]|uniref:hypothetical protein n=1 Tax=Streptomyces sp. DT197 TaxID=3393417 RepID=UPI003CF09A38